MRLIAATLSVLVLITACGSSPPYQPTTPSTAEASALPDDAIVATPTPVPTAPPPPAVPFRVGDGPADSPLPAPESLPPGTVVLRADGLDTTGSGVVFLERRRDTLVRLLVGAPNEYVQFDLPAAEDGSITVGPGRGDPSVIYGGDAAGTDFTVTDGAAPNAGTLWLAEPDSAVSDGPITNWARGTIDMTVRHYTGREFRLEAVWNVQAHTTGEWTCDWDGPLVADCGFFA